MKAEDSRGGSGGASLSRRCFPTCVIFAVGVALVATAEVFADGDSVTHARQHASGALISCLVAVAAAGWRPRTAAARYARYGLLGAVTLLSASQTVESIGATGDDSLAVLAESELHRELHELGNAFTTLSLLLVLLAFASVIATFAMERFRRDPSR